MQVNNWVLSQFSLGFQILGNFCLWIFIVKALFYVFIRITKDLLCIT